MFDFLGSEHPLSAFAAARAAELDRLLTPRSQPTHVAGADLKMSQTPTGDWEPSRLICHLEGGGDTAVWVWSTRTPEARLTIFPDDTYMPGVSAWTSAPHSASGKPLSDLKRLRYVPTRRVTFSAAVDDAPANRMIVKFKRASKLDQSAAMLDAVYRAASAKPRTPAIARLLGTLPDHAAFCQSFLPGHPLADAVTRTSISGMMHRAGRVHADLHDLDVAGVPKWRLEKYIATIATDIEWVSYMMPQLDRDLRAAWSRIEPALRRSDSWRSVFCHGDFVPAQLLLDGDRIAVTDFDMARRGLDLQEIAKWIACLKYHLPLLAHVIAAGSPDAARLLAEAEAAYLDGYQVASDRSIQMVELVAFIAAAEIHYLGIWLKKDRVSEPAFAMAHTRILDIASQL